MSVIATDLNDGDEPRPVGALEARISARGTSRANRRAKRANASLSHREVDLFGRVRLGNGASDAESFSRPTRGPGGCAGTRRHCHLSYLGRGPRHGRLSHPRCWRLPRLPAGSGRIRTEALSAHRHSCAHRNCRLGGRICNSRAGGANRCAPRACCENIILLPAIIL